MVRDKDPIESEYDNNRPLLYNEKDGNCDVCRYTRASAAGTLYCKKKKVNLRVKYKQTADWNACDMKDFVPQEFTPLPSRCPLCGGFSFMSGKLIDGKFYLSCPDCGFILGYKEVPLDEQSK